MNEGKVEVVTILTMELPSDIAGGVHRRTRLRGEPALEVVRIIANNPPPSTVIYPEESPTDLATAVEYDLEEVFAGIAPECSICGEEFDMPHPACEMRVLDYLRFS